MVTAIVGENTAAVIEDDRSAFEWGPVLAGAVVAAATTFFLVLVGAALGLSLAGTRNAIGAHSFLTLGAIYFLAAQAFGFALGGYITGRLMRTQPENEDEHFRADAHGLAVWSLAVVIGLMFVGMATAAGLTQAAASPSQPMAYWADRLLAGATLDNYAVRNDEASRLLTADMAHSGQINPEHDRLVRLVAVQNAIPLPAAEDRVTMVENGIHDQLDATRRALLYLVMWTAFALLFGGVIAVTATVMARFHGEDFSLKHFSRSA